MTSSKPLRSSEGGRRPTLYDVAEAAGVSHQTVSQVVKNGPNVRPVTRERVERAIAQLGYRPNMTARALASARSHRIGALFFDRYDEIGPTRNMQAAVDYARGEGYVVDVLGVDSHRPEEVQQAVDLLLQSNVAGIIAFAPTDEAIGLVEAQRLTVPVMLEARMQPVAADAHLRTASDGMRLVTDHIVDLGHRSVLHVTGPRTWHSAIGRMTTVRNAATDHGLSLREVEGDWTARSGFEAILDVDLGDVTAIVASNDQMALGALKALRRRGLDVPRSISVVGYDDVPEAGYYEPSLTTVIEDFDGRGRLAMRRLLAEVAGSAHPEDWYELPRLVLRDSTAAPAR